MVKEAVAEGIASNNPFSILGSKRIREPRIADPKPKPKKAADASKTAKAAAQAAPAAEEKKAEESKKPEPKPEPKREAKVVSLAEVQKQEVARKEAKEKAKEKEKGKEEKKEKGKEEKKDTQEKEAKPEEKKDAKGEKQQKGQTGKGEDKVAESVWQSVEVTDDAPAPTWDDVPAAEEKPSTSPTTAAAQDAGAGAAPAKPDQQTEEGNQKPEFTYEEYLERMKADKVEPTKFNIRTVDASKFKGMAVYGREEDVFITKKQGKAPAEKAQSSDKPQPKKSEPKPVAKEAKKVDVTKNMGFKMENPRRGGARGGAALGSRGAGRMNRQEGGADESATVRMDLEAWPALGGRAATSADSTSP